MARPSLWRLSSAGRIHVPKVLVPSFQKMARAIDQQQTEQARLILEDVLRQYCALPPAPAEPQEATFTLEPPVRPNRVDPYEVRLEDEEPIPGDVLLAAFHQTTLTNPECSEKVLTQTVREPLHDDTVTTDSVESVESVESIESVESVERVESLISEPEPLPVKAEGVAITADRETLHPETATTQVAVNLDAVTNVLPLAATFSQGMTNKQVALADQTPLATDRETVIEAVETSETAAALQPTVEPTIEPTVALTVEVDLATALVTTAINEASANDAHNLALATVACQQENTELTLSFGTALKQPHFEPQPHDGAAPVAPLLQALSALPIPVHLTINLDGQALPPAVDAPCGTVRSETENGGDAADEPEQTLTSEPQPQAESVTHFEPPFAAAEPGGGDKLGETQNSTPKPTHTPLIITAEALRLPVNLEQTANVELHSHSFPKPIEATGTSVESLENTDKIHAQNPLEEPAVPVLKTATTLLQPTPLVHSQNNFVVLGSNNQTTSTQLFTPQPPAVLEAITDLPTIATAETPTQIPTEAATEPSTEPSAETSAENPVESPVETVTEPSTETLAESPVEPSTEPSTESSTETLAESPTETPTTPLIPTLLPLDEAAEQAAFAEALFRTWQELTVAKRGHLDNCWGLHVSLDFLYSQGFTHLTAYCFFRFLEQQVKAATIFSQGCLKVSQGGTTEPVNLNGQLVNRLTFFPPGTPPHLQNTAALRAQREATGEAPLASHGSELERIRQEREAHVATVRQEKVKQKVQQSRTQQPGGLLGALKQLGSLFS